MNTDYSPQRREGAGTFRSKRFFWEALRFDMGHDIVGSSCYLFIGVFERRPNVGHRILIVLVQRWPHKLEASKNAQTALDCGGAQGIGQCWYQDRTWDFKLAQNTCRFSTHFFIFSNHAFDNGWQDFHGLRMQHRQIFYRGKLNFRPAFREQCVKARSASGADTAKGFDTIIKSFVILQMQGKAGEFWNRRTELFTEDEINISGTLQGTGGQPFEKGGYGIRANLADGVVGRRLLTRDVRNFRVNLVSPLSKGMALITWFGIPCHGCECHHPCGGNKKDFSPLLYHDGIRMEFSRRGASEQSN